MTWQSQPRMRTHSGRRHVARRRALLRCGLATLLLTAAASTAESQVLLEGTVYEFESEQVIEGVFVEVIDPNNANRRLAGTLTDAAGKFSFNLGYRSAYRIRASRIGYQPTTTVVLWRDDFEAIWVDIRLDTEAVVLAPLEVIARAGVRPSPVLDDFRVRRERGLGKFVTRGEIEARNPMFVTDVLTQIPGVHLESSGRGTRRTIYLGRGTRACPAEIYVDGMLLTRHSRMGPDAGFTLDDAVAPSDVEGIEVYSGIASIPAEFLSPRAGCGVIAVWTIRGEGR